MDCSIILLVVSARSQYSLVLPHRLSSLLLSSLRAGLHLISLRARRRPYRPRSPPRGPDCEITLSSVIVDLTLVLACVPISTRPMED